MPAPLRVYQPDTAPANAGGVGVTVHQVVELYLAWLGSRVQIGRFAGQRLANVRRYLLGLRDAHQASTEGFGAYGG